MKQNEIYQENIPLGGGGLTLAGCQLPAKPLYHSLSSAGQGEKI